TKGWLYSFQGLRYDADTGLLSARNRDLSVGMMRWISNDPMGYVDGLNTYQGFAANPINGLDPDGLAKRVYIFEGFSGFNGDAANILHQGKPVNDSMMSGMNLSAPWALVHLVQGIVDKDKDAVWQYYAETDANSAIKDALAHAKTPIATTTRP